MVYGEGCGPRLVCAPRQGGSALPTNLLAQLGVEAEVGTVVKTFRARDLSELVRETVSLTSADIQSLATLGPEHSQTTVRQIRAYHHMVALRLALGERPIQICAALGLTPQTITKLQATPQFAELVAEYRGRVVTKAIDHVELMSAVGGEALSVLLERLSDDDRDDIPIESLRRIAETFVDRIGHSPVRRSETANVHRIELDDEQIARIKSLHGEDRRYDPSRVIDAVITSHEEASTGVGAAAGAAAVFLPASREDKDDPDAGRGAGI